MFLQILPTSNAVKVTTHNTFDLELLFVILGLTFSVFLILRLTKYLSKVK